MNENKHEWIKTNKHEYRLRPNSTETFSLVPKKGIPKLIVSKSDLLQEAVQIFNPWVTKKNMKENLKNKHNKQT